MKTLTKIGIIVIIITLIAMGAYLASVSVFFVYLLFTADRLAVGNIAISVVLILPFSTINIFLYIISIKNLIKRYYNI